MVTEPPVSVSVPVQGFADSLTVKNPVLPPTDVVGPHGASSKEKAIFAIHPLPEG